MKQSINNDKELNEAIDSGRVKRLEDAGAFKTYLDIETNEMWICI